METPAAARRYGVRIDALQGRAVAGRAPGDARLRERGRDSHRHLCCRACAAAARAARGRVQCVAQRGCQGCRVRARPDAEDAQRPLGSTDAAGRGRRGRLGRSSANGLTGSIEGVAAVPFDPPLSFPIDFASSPTEERGTAGGHSPSSARRRRVADAPARANGAARRLSRVGSRSVRRSDFLRVARGGVTSLSSTEKEASMASTRTTATVSR